MDTEEKQEDAGKETATAHPPSGGVADIQVTAGIVTPYRVRRLTKHLDLLWKHTAGETYVFKPIKVRSLD